MGDYGVHWGFSRQFHPDFDFISAPLCDTAAVVPIAQQASYSKPHPFSSHPPLPLDPPSPCLPGPHPFHRVPVPTRAHPPLVCFCLLAKASLFRPLAALHHFPCFFLLKLCFYMTEDGFLSILSCSFTFQKAGKIYVLGYWFSQGLLAFFSTKACLIKEHHIDLIKGSNSQNWFCPTPSRMGLNLDSVQNGGWKVPKASLFVTCHHLPKPPGGRLREAACLCTMFLFFFIYLFIYLFIFGCVGSSSLCKGFLQLRQAGATLHRGARAFSLSRPLLLRSTSSRCAGSVVVAHGPSCSLACGIFPDQGSSPCPLH